MGKTLAAQLFAQAVNCESPAAEEAAKAGLFLDEPCLSCGSCRRITEDPKRHAHPLVTWVDTEQRMQQLGLYDPESDRAPARAIGVRLLRELIIPRLALRISGGRRKVAIFHDVDFTEGAQNAFLKTLEEPPSDTTFILLSSTPDALKPTIRSRCARVAFSPLPLEVVSARVAEARKMDRSTADLCAAVSGGSLGRALEVQPKELETRRQIILSAERLASDDHAGWLQLAEVLSGKEDALVAIDVLETWLHDVALAAAAGRSPSTHLDLAAEAEVAGERLGVEETLRRLELIQRARTAIERNGQPRLALERAFLGFAGITPLALVEG